MQDGKLHKDIGIRLCYLHIDIYRGEMYNKLTRRCCYWAEKVTFPDGLQTIGNEAFDRNGLKELEIPESVSYIGKSAFSWCRKLEEVKLPENPTKLSDKIFYE